MNRIARPPSTPTAAALETALRQLGYQPGYPPHVAPMTRAVDRQSARKMVCPVCRNRGLGCKPFRRDQSFRVVCVCKCGFGTEA